MSFFEQWRKNKHVISGHPLERLSLPKDNINSLRGLACVLLVASHSLISTEDVLNRNDGVLDAVNYLLTPVRMPLFSFLSGLLYAYRPVHAGELIKFVIRKAQRILIPFVFVTILIVLLKEATYLITPSSEANIVNIPKLLITGYGHLWFLQAIFFVYILFATLDVITTDRKGVAVIALFFSWLAYTSSAGSIELFSLGRMFFLLPFFILGVVLVRYCTIIAMHQFTISVVAILAYIGWALWVLTGNLPSHQPMIGSLITLSAGTFGTVALVLIFPDNNYLIRIGKYSFSIYLFHTIFLAAAARIAPDSLIVHFCVGFAFAMAGPIILERLIVRRAPYLNFAIGKYSAKTGPHPSN